MKIPQLLIAASIAAAGTSNAASGAAETFLRCDAEHLFSKTRTEFSVVVRERNATAEVNGFKFVNVKFTSSRIDGEMRQPDTVYPEINRLTSFSVDRITGAFSFTQFADINGGGPATPAQVEALNRRTDANAAFSGKCEKAVAKF